MLRQFFQIVAEGLANTEREFFRASRKSLKESGLLYAPAIIFAYLMAGIKYIFLNFLLLFAELLILIFLSPEEGHELLTFSRHPEPDSGHPEPAGEGSPRFFGRRLPQNDRTYEDYQKKQKKVRRWTSWTFGTAVAAVAIVSLVLNLVVPLAPESLGATNTFTQTNWGGGSSSNNAIHPTNQSGWSQYNSTSSEITAVNGGEDLELVPHSASSTQTTDTQFNAGTYSTTTVSGSGSSASVKLSKALHINEYTIGALSNIAVTASSVTTNSNGTWTIAFSGTPNLARIFKNDKFTDSASKAWKVLSVAPNVYKIIVVDSEGNGTAPSTGSGQVGRWYASIFAWEAGRQDNLTATGRNAIERGLPYYDGAPDTTTVDMNGWTTDATHYVEIFVPYSERHRGKWDNNKYRLDVPDSNYALKVSALHARIDGLQIKINRSFAYSIHGIEVEPTANGSDIRISNSIITSGPNTDNTAVGILVSYNTNLSGVATGAVRIYNNIIYGFASSDANPNSRGISAYEDSLAIYAYNNTVYGGPRYCYYDQTSSGLSHIFAVKNDIAQNCSTKGFGSVDGNGFNGGLNSNNISSLADAPGANSKNSTTTPFISVSTQDFHLEFRDGTGNPAMNAGADLSADANLAFTTDIDGDTRSGTWDIGADDVGATLVMPHSIGTVARDFSTLQAWEDARDGVLTTRNVFKISGQSGAFTEDETITGTSGATGTYIKERDTPSASETYMTVDKVNATAFVAGETLTGGTSNATATISAILTTAGTIEKGEAYKDSTFTVSVTIDDSTADASHYMWLTAEPGSRHTGVAGTGAKVEIAGTAFGIRDMYTTVDYFDISSTAGGYGINYSIGWPNNYGTIRNNIIHDVSYGIYAGPIWNSSAYNNIIYNVTGGFTGMDPSTKAYNNTIYNATSYGISRDSAESTMDIILRNNIIASSTIAYKVNSGSWGASSSNNISSDATAPGTGSQTNVALSSVKFVSTASDFIDLHIMDGSVAKDAGADLSATFKNDIDGSSRLEGGTWDVGADEWFSSSPVYNSSGTFTSATIDLGSTADLSTITWNPTTQPANTNLWFEAAANNDNATWNYLSLGDEAYPAGVTVEERLIRQDCTGYSNCYTSLAIWEDGEDGTGSRNLVAENKIAVAKIDGPWTNQETGTVTIDGWTTNATHYIRIYTTPAARHTGKWDTAKYRLEVYGWDTGIDVRESYTRIDGLQIRNSGGSGGGNIGIDVDTYDPTGTRISNNIIKLTGTPTGGTYKGIHIDSYTTGSHYVWNNIIYDYQYAGTGMGIEIRSAGSYVYNNTIVNCDIGIASVYDGPLVAKNNIVQGATDGFLSNGGNFTGSDYNISSLASDASGANSKNLTTVAFVDAVNKDFRLASSDTAAKNAGADLSVDANLAVKTDILGHSRPTGANVVDIGAHETSYLRYLRYKAYLSTADTAFSPQLDDLTVNYSYYATTSPYLTSSPYNSNDATNILGKIAWTATTTSGTEARVQVRSAPNSGGVPGTWSQWCGYTACDDADYFATSTNNVDLGASHPLKNGGNDQWLQYKVILVSTGATTPTFGNIVLTYIVNAPPDLQNVTASQRTSDGKVDVVYEVRDTDTATGTTTPGFITPSFSYSTDGGLNWTAITSGYLSAGNLSNKQVCDGAGTYGGLNCAVTQYTQYTATWDAKAQLNGTYATNTKIMITATDNEGANNSSSVATSAFTLDVKNPVATVTVDGTKDGQAGAITTSITDNSSAQMMLSNLSNYASDGLNGSSGTWIATSTSLTWNFVAGDPARVYGKFKDAYQNELAVAPDAPSTPANATIQDTSNLNLSEFREFVSWSVNAAGDFGSYKVYRSTDGSSYSLLSTISSVATNYLTDGSSGAWLSNGTTYYYKIIASDATGNISRYSSAVSDIPDGQGGTDVTPPTITNLSSSAVNTTQATITWTTDELSNSTVYYSTDSSYSSSKAVASMVTAHSATLTGLTPNTAYNFRVRSTDPLGNVSSYATGTPFTTSQGPVISGVTAVSVSGNSAIIVWNTNSNSDSWVTYSTNSDLSGSQTTGTSTLVGGSGPNYEHRVSLSSLNTNAKYYFKVRSVDGSSNSAEDNNGGNYYTFSTAQDVTAPVISSVSAILSSQTSTVISWLTNEPADSQVVYGLDQNSLTSQTSVNSTMTINHSMILSDLTAGATYYYKVVSADSSGNSTQSAVYNFSTTALALENTLVVTRYVESGPPVVIDKTSPLITDVKVDDITESSATATWRTNEEADSFVEYGPPDILGSTHGQRESVKAHRVVLMDLKSNARYAFRATSADASGNVSVSLAVNFQTLSPKTVAEKIGDQIEQSAREKIKDFKIENQEDIARLTKEIEEIIAQVSAKVAPPKIIGAEPKVEVSSSFAVISWVTDRPANSIVAYAGDGDYKPNADEPYQSTAGNPDEQVTEHNVVLSNLAPGTTYHFQVRSKGLIGGIGKSADFSFKTGEEATISGIEIKDITKNSATIFWRTNLPATTLLEYGRSVDYGSTQTDASMNTSHTVLLKGLQPGTMYHFRAGGIDKNNKSFFSPDLNFVTEALPSLLNVKIDSVKEREMTVTWFTDVISDSTVEYTNGITKKTEAVSDKQLVKNHTMTITGLDENVPYSLKVISKDEKGNEVKSSEYNLQTAKDVQPPAITNIQTQSAVSSRDKVQTIVSWRTIEPATSRVIYQEGAMINPAMEKSSPLNSDFKTNHVVVFTNFKPGAVYRLRIESVDGSGNTSSSKDITILTPQKQETVIDLIIKNFQDVFKWTEKIR